MRACDTVAPVPPDEAFAKDSLPRPEAVSPSSDPGGGYARYVLGVLFLVYVANFVDRQILSILLPSIQAEIGASDTQLGFLTGFAFAIFYTTFGLPIARWADRGNRSSIIAAGLALWSLMTAACGLAQSFWQLAIARVGVGVGEAAGSPPAHSLISDYFPPASRATAFSVYNFGIPVGVMLGYLAGGWIDEYFDWRVAFFVAGVPGLLLALVLRTTVREPVRGHSETQAVDAGDHSFADTARHLMRVRTFVLLAFGGGFSAFASYGFGAWVPTFLKRIHAMGSGEIGTWIGLESGIGGVLGMLGTGLLADRLARRDARWPLWIAAASIALYVPFSAVFLLAEDPVLGLAAYFVPCALGSVYLAPLLVVIHSLVPLRMRAVASAVALFFMNLIGMGLGPQAVGLISDLAGARDRRPEHPLGAARRARDQGDRGRALSARSDYVSGGPGRERARDRRAARLKRRVDRAEEGELASAEIERAVDRLIDERPGRELLHVPYDEAAVRIHERIWRSAGSTASYLLDAGGERVIVNCGMGLRGAPSSRALRGARKGTDLVPDHDPGPRRPRRRRVPSSASPVRVMSRTRTTGNVSPTTRGSPPSGPGPRSPGSPTCRATSASS